MGSPPGWEPGRRETGQGGGRPGAALGIVVLTLILTALLGGCAALMSFVWAMSGNSNSPWGSGESVPPGVVIVGVLAGACLIGGLVWAWRVGSGRLRSWEQRQPLPGVTKPAAGLEPSPGAEPGPGRAAATGAAAETGAGSSLRGERRVLEPGTPLQAEPDGEVVVWLLPGTVVVEQERRGSMVRVTTLRGTGGWVTADRLERSGRPPSAGESTGDG